MDLFEYNIEQNMKKNAPLAARMRPESLEEFVGQEHIIGKGKLLYRAIKGTNGLPAATVCGAASAS